MADKPEPHDDNKGQANDETQPSEAEEKLVDDIQRHDSDELLEADNPKHHEAVVIERAWHKKLWAKLVTHKKFSIPAAVVLLLVILSAVPFTRYPILGLFLKDNYTLAVWDSQTNQPVSAATVSLAGKTATTDNHGVAHLKVKVGHHILTVSKNYYKMLSSKILVPLRSHAGDTPYTLVATGRQVPVMVINKINGQPINDATVKAADTEAHTDKTGKVIIVVPANKSTLAATISASGYNDTPATIQVTTQAVKANDFQITPAGKVYFLSKLSGTIDVVKTNLDGTDRQTVLAGTGNEDDTGTVLLASRDWKYLALLSIRDTTGNAQLNLIDTSNDQVTNIDKGNASFTDVGWSGHYFVYEVNRNGYQPWQANQTALKSFNADTKQLVTIDQTQADVTTNPTLTPESNYAAENISWIFEVGNKVVYFKTWTGEYSVPLVEPSKLTGKQAEIVSADPSGTKVTVKSYSLETPQDTSYLNPLSSYGAVLYEPNGIYFELNDDQGNTTYDKYEDGQVTENDQGSQDYFTTNSKTYPTFLISPSGNQTFWSEERDGKNTLFVGDADGNNGKQIATLSAYDTYGWFTDNYLLVSENSDELYIMPVTGGTPIQVSDYHKPAVTYNGYGGGYGGQ